MRLGVVGWPLDHTFSPAMQNAALDACGLTDWRYDAVPVPPDQLDVVWPELVAARPDVRGFNITVPHKRAALRLCTRVDAVARAVGAINTVVIERSNDRLEIVGYNTDVTGVAGALGEAGISAAGNSALVFGAGGAARAVVFALLGLGVRRIIVVARRLDRAVELIHDLALNASAVSARGERAPLTAVALDDATRVQDELLATQLVCNATTLGMRDAKASVVRPELLAPGTTLLDCVYFPGRETALVAGGRARGLVVADGLALLLHQGARSFDLWTGRAAPLAAMRAALERANARSGGDAPAP
ncbi:MAG: shikimate dehydrogenase family protein [Planctomycetota bacterium]